MRYLFIVLSLLFFPMTAANAEVSVGISFPGVSIGINMPRYPTLVRVPGYPVYYDPQVDTNYFFYDGLYWVLLGDDWYASSWYNGPWERVDRYDVPLYVLRVPVRYYRQPPSYFRGWRADAAPHWGEHWGRDWEQRRSGWDHWNRRAAPPPAPLPTYQRNYYGDRYPHAVEQQHSIRSEKYRYQPRDAVTEQYFQQRQKQSRDHQDRQYQQDQRRVEEQRQQQDQQRHQDQQRQEERQRQDQLRQQDHQQRLEQDQQRRQERQHQDEQRQQNQQRVQEQRQHQDQQRQQDQQRVQEQRQPQDPQRVQPASQDREQKRKDAPKDHGRDRNRDEERDQNR